MAIICYIVTMNFNMVQNSFTFMVISEIIYKNYQLPDKGVFYI